jgi:hypothetical protein
METTRAIDMIHYGLVVARTETGKACDALLDAFVPWDSDEYQAARKANAEAIAALAAYRAMKNGAK